MPSPTAQSDTLDIRLEEYFINGLVYIIDICMHVCIYICSYIYIFFFPVKDKDEPQHIITQIFLIDQQSPIG